MRERERKRPVVRHGTYNTFDRGRNKKSRL
jgi:hypothetical protein